LARSEKPATDVLVDSIRELNQGMKTTILTVTAALVLTGGIWLRAQQSDEGVAGTPGGSNESKTAMIEHCKHMCATQINPESPENLLAWKQELSLTEDQVRSLRTVEEKAVSDAKALLSAEQVGKLKELARDTKPDSTMQCMMHATKEKMGHAMSMHCPPMHGKAEH
jgi:hypothetical protein